MVATIIDQFIVCASAFICFDHPIVFSFIALEADLDTHGFVEIVEVQPKHIEVVKEEHVGHDGDLSSIKRDLRHELKRVYEHPDWQEWPAP